MKNIMIPIVTILILTLVSHASTTVLKNGFTVTQIALDAEAEAENMLELQQALIEIEEDENTTKKGGNTEKI